jgi:hypothetical protein
MFQKVWYQPLHQLRELNKQLNVRVFNFFTCVILAVQCFVEKVNYFVLPFCSQIHPRCDESVECAFLDTLVQQWFILGLILEGRR